MRRCLIIFAALVAGSSALTGCGGEDPKPLSIERLEAAVLQDDDVPQGFATNADVAGETVEDDQALGCFKAEALLDLDEVDKASASYASAGLSSTGGLISEVRSYRTVDEIDQALDDFRKEVEGCTAIDETNGEGLRSQLTLTSDQKSTSKEADEQLNIQIEGTVSQRGSSLPYQLVLSYTRLTNNLAVVGALEFGEVDDSAVVVTDLEKYSDLVVGRVAKAPS